MGAGMVAAVPSLVGTVTIFEPWDALQSIACGTRQDFRRTDLATIEGRGVFAVEMNVGETDGQIANLAFGIGWGELSGACKASEPCNFASRACYGPLATVPVC